MCLFSTELATLLTEACGILSIPPHDLCRVHSYPLEWEHADVPDAGIIREKYLHTLYCLNSQTIVGVFLLSKFSRWNTGDFQVISSWWNSYYLLSPDCGNNSGRTTEAWSISQQLKTKLTAKNSHLHTINMSSEVVNVVYTNTHQRIRLCRVELHCFVLTYFSDKKKILK